MDILIVGAVVAAAIGSLAFALLQLAVYLRERRFRGWWLLPVAFTLLLGLSPSVKIISGYSVRSRRAGMFGRMQSARLHFGECLETSSCDIKSVSSSPDFRGLGFAAGGVFYRADAASSELALPQNLVNQTKSGAAFVTDGRDIWLLTSTAEYLLFTKNMPLLGR